MEKRIVIFCLFGLSLISVRLLCNEEKSDTCFSTALTAGFVFKDDVVFKEVYGHGIINAITLDGCYYRWNPWGVGAKISYWRAKGKTTFLKYPSVVQEIPVTFYVRRLLRDFDCGVQAYASAGGGFVWLKEKSYIGTARLYKGIGEVEIGLFYPVWSCINITGAFRYLFPFQSIYCEKSQVGGFDLRAGIAFLF